MSNVEMTMRFCASADGLADELSGYVDLGMKREALRLIRKILSKRKIKPEEFSAVMNTLGFYDKYGEWETSIEAAYKRQSARFRRAARIDILCFYHSAGDWEKAAKFVSVRLVGNAGQAFFSMEPLLRTGRLDDARRLARRARVFYRLSNTAFEESLWVEVIASYCAWVGKWDEAEKYWKLAPFDQFFRRNALDGIAGIHLARALQTVCESLSELDYLKKCPKRDTEMQFRENEGDLARDAERELLKLKRGIEKLLPVERWKELGMENQIR